MILPCALNAKPLRVVTEYLAPYQIKQEDGTLGGYMTEVVHAIFAKTEFTPEIEVMPWTRALRIASTEENVLIYSIVKTPSRENDFHWIGTFPMQPMYLWGLSNQYPESVDTLDDVRGSLVTSLRGSNVADYLQQQVSINFVSLGEQDSLLGMLVLDRVDLVAGTPKAIAIRAEKRGVDFESLTPVIELDELSINLHLAFNINSDPELVSSFNQAYAELKVDGTLDRIRARWYEE